MAEFEKLKVTSGEFNTYKIALAIADLYIEKYECYKSFFYNDLQPTGGTLEEISNYFLKNYDEKNNYVDMEKIPIDPYEVLLGLNNILERCQKILIELKNELRAKLVQEDLKLCLMNKKTSRKRKITERQLVFMEWFMNNISSLNYKWQNMVISEEGNKEDNCNEKTFIFSKSVPKKEIKKEWKEYCQEYKHPFLFSTEFNKKYYVNLVRSLYKDE